MMEEAFIALLLNAAGVTAVVGNRINYIERPQASALPAIVLQRIDGRRGYHSQGADGLIASRVQADCWGQKYSEAKIAARAVIAATSGFRGVVAGIRFGGCFVDDESDGFEDGSNDGAGNAERLFRTRLDLIIWHNEGV